MAERMVDLTLTLTDNMPAHKLFQRPVIVPHYTHEQTREQFFLGWRTTGSPSPPPTWA